MRFRKYFQIKSKLITCREWQCSGLNTKLQSWGGILSHIRISSKPFGSVEQFRYFGTTLTNQNCIHEQTKSRLQSGNACYHSVQNLLSSSLLSKKYKYQRISSSCGDAAQRLLILEVSRSHSDKPHSVGLRYTSDGTVTETSTWQHTTLTTDRHSCQRRDSNPQSQKKRAAADLHLRPRGHWDRPKTLYRNT